ncbi:MAG: FAD-binding oxidoreductase [Solirubrobacteraceae bacterium]
MDRDGAATGLRAGFVGEVILPSDAGYDEARKVFNGMIDRRPAAIARCATTADVVSAVNFAREHDLVVAVRCGGHSVAGLSVCDDGVLIDLSSLKSIHVDPEAKTASAGGGVLWSEFDAATQEHALHTPGGRVSTTGVGGFATGGGYGWTSCKHGLTSDNLMSAEVVLADGRVVRASKHENQDLLWGLRGGGGNFGIVTEFEFKLHELGPTVLAGLTMWPVDLAPSVLRAWRDYADNAPDEVGSGFAVITAPPEPFVPDELKGQTVCGIAAIYVGDAEAGVTAMQPLKDLAPAVDLIVPMPYVAFQAMLDATAPRGMQNYWRGEYLRELSDGAIDTFLDHAPSLVAAASPFAQALIFRIGQGITAVSEDDSAFSHRDASYLFHPLALWPDPAKNDELISASRAFAAAMRSFGTGAAYLNFTPEQDRVRDGFGEAKYARLVALKDKYDPENLFRLNHNIKPSRHAGEPVLA